MSRRAIVVVVLMLASIGCANAGRRAPADGASAEKAQRAGEPAPGAALAQLAAEIAPELRPASPATRPTTRPALEAVELYARARGALAERQAYTAVDLLERAVRLDPESAELHFSLGRAYQLRGGSPERAEEALSRASELNPRSLDAWLELARLYFRTNPVRALRPLIYATRTDDYADNDGDAAVVDFHLARALQQAGHDRAAADQYERLLKRLGRRSLSIRGNPEVAALAAHPEPVQVELG
jgi:tetratricopeptide (TPR) repeat protein